MINIVIWLGKIKYRGLSIRLCKLLKLSIPTIAPKDVELAADDTPVGIRHGPFGNNVQRAEIQDFQYGHLVWKGSFAIGNFTQRRIERDHPKSCVNLRCGV